MALQALLVVALQRRRTVASHLQKFVTKLSSKPIWQLTGCGSLQGIQSHEHFLVQQCGILHKGLPRWGGR